MALCLLQESLDIASERNFDYLQQHFPHRARCIGSRENVNARKRLLAPYPENVRHNLAHHLHTMIRP